MCEYLINDYTRRGFINGFSLRFPTISVRPGKPTAAASSFISGVIREPMAGKECIVPIVDRNWSHWMCSPKTLVGNLVVALGLERDALPVHRRAINMPGFRVTVQDSKLIMFSSVSERSMFQITKCEFCFQRSHKFDENSTNFTNLSVGRFGESRWKG